MFSKKSKRQGRKKITRTSKNKIKRKISYKQRKNNKSKKRTFKKKYYGGKFNPKDTNILINKLEEMGFTEDEIPKIMDELHLGAHYFSGTDLKQLFNQMEGMNKEQFKTWLKNQYSFIAEDDETDYESD